MQAAAAQGSTGVDTPRETCKKHVAPRRTDRYEICVVARLHEPDLLSSPERHGAPSRRGSSEHANVLRLSERARWLGRARNGARARAVLPPHKLQPKRLSTTTNYVRALRALPATELAQPSPLIS